MHLHFENVNNAFRGLVKGLHEKTIPAYQTDSRNGPVLRCAEPMSITYYKPMQRVLLNRQRDCNLFFHLFESLWMLAGHNDVAPLAYYNSNIANYSDDGKTFHGAYGHRWRQFFGWDQLHGICAELKKNPGSRRCVLQVWNACGTIRQRRKVLTDDFWLGVTGGKDVPCNTQAYFDIRPTDNGGVLDMTVCNRSNDLIWGMLGANVVHFSMLQEYMAACIGVKVGHYTQFSNNLHVYEDKWQPKKWLSEYHRTMHSQPELAYDKFKQLMPLVSRPEIFDQEVEEFIDNKDWTRNWQEPFLQKVASPMCWAFKLHKAREYTSALKAVELVESDDWQTMGTIWIQQRKEQWERKNAKTSPNKS